MILENPEKYKFLRFEKSHLKNKKYDAVLLNKETGRERKVPFGSVFYQQYKDSTGLNVYSKLDHLDKDRRKRYRERHKGEEKNKFSSGYWSYKYLW
jgi:hypothetical protein